MNTLRILWQTGVISAIFVAAIFNSSCTALKAKEAPDSGFLESTEQMEEHRERFPFNKVWLKDYSENYYDKYTEIMIAPVDTGHMLEMDWTDKLSLAGEKRVKKDAVAAGKYLRDQFVKAIEKSEEKRFVLVDKAGPKTLILEMALVELVPTKAWLNVAGNAGGFFVPGAGAATGLASSGSVAIEGRLRDGGTGEVVAMFKDREKDQASPIGLQDYTWYHHSKNAAEDWAKQFTKILETKADDKVADSRPFTLRMW